jgi:hypothetical protein
MFIPNDGGFWRPQEQANQFVHWFFGLWVAFIMYKLNTGLIIPLLSGFIPFVFELSRQLIFDKPTLNTDLVKDKIRDCAFYLIGSASLYIFIKWPL